MLINQEPILHSVRVHERCDTPIEYIVTSQWFINVLDSKDDLLAAGEKVNWHPAHLQSRYRTWVEDLKWDWCISRQRYYGVPFPIWYCKECDEIILAEEHQLPVEPLDEHPEAVCPSCGSQSFQPDPDVMDTWATSSLSPQIAGQWLRNPKLYEKVHPFSLRPQAHEIIRTWAFYTIVKSTFHFDEIPWRDALISGWGIAGEGLGKISKSRGGGPMPPLEMIEQYSADAVRYWAASTGPGKDAIISEEKIRIGGKLINKIWNVGRFSSRFIESYTPLPALNFLTPADLWILSRTQRLIERVTALFSDYDYAAAKAETETFFWQFADNYLEIAKQRLYDEDHPQRAGAQFSIYQVLLTVIKLFAPILPHITERIYQGIFTTSEGDSVHRSQWPVADPELINVDVENLGDVIIDIATAVRRYKSERNLSLGTELKRLQLTIENSDLRIALEDSRADLMSITRATQVDFQNQINTTLENFSISNEITFAVEI